MQPFATTTCAVELRQSRGMYGDAEWKGRERGKGTMERGNENGEEVKERGKSREERG